MAEQFDLTQLRTFLIDSIKEQLERVAEARPNSLESETARLRADTYCNVLLHVDEAESRVWRERIFDKTGKPS